MAGTWKELSVELSLPIIETLDELKFKNPTPVQAACIPLFMKNKDVPMTVLGYFSEIVIRLQISGLLILL
jgi:hypothetical protein